MIVSKQVADILTAMRVILAFLFPVLGANQGADALPIAVWMLIACWTSMVPWLGAAVDNTIPGLGIMTSGSI